MRQPPVHFASAGKAGHLVDFERTKKAAAKSPGLVADFRRNNTNVVLFLAHYLTHLHDSARDNPQTNAQNYSLEYSDASTTTALSSSWLWHT